MLQHNGLFVSTTQHTNKCDYSVASTREDCKCQILPYCQIKDITRAYYCLEGNDVQSKKKKDPVQCKKGRFAYRLHGDVITPLET